MYRLLIADNGGGGDDDDDDDDDSDIDDSGDRGGDNEDSNEDISDDRVPFPLPLSNFSRGVESGRPTNGSTVPAPAPTPAPALETRGIIEEPDFVRGVEAEISRAELCESPGGVSFRLRRARGGK